MLDIISRDMWRASPPKGEKLLTSACTLIYIGYTRSIPCNTLRQCSTVLRTMQMMEAKYNHRDDLPYNFLVGVDGQVYEGRGWGVRPSLPPKFAQYEETSLYIGFMAKPPEQLSEMVSNFTNIKDKLIQYGVVNNHIVNYYSVHPVYDFAYWRNAQGKGTKDTVATTNP